MSVTCPHAGLAVAVVASGGDRLHAAIPEEWRVGAMLSGEGGLTRCSAAISRCAWATSTSRRSTCPRRTARPRPERPVVADNALDYSTRTSGLDLLRTDDRPGDRDILPRPATAAIDVRGAPGRPRVAPGAGSPARRRGRAEHADSGWYEGVAVGTASPIASAEELTDGPTLPAHDFGALGANGPRRETHGAASAAAVRGSSVAPADEQARAQQRTGGGRRHPGDVRWRRAPRPHRRLEDTVCATPTHERGPAGHLARGHLGPARRNADRLDAGLRR